MADFKGFLRSISTYDARIYFRMAVWKGENTIDSLERLKIPLKVWKDENTIDSLERLKIQSGLKMRGCIRSRLVVSTG